MLSIFNNNSIYIKSVYMLYGIYYVFKCICNKRIGSKYSRFFFLLVFGKYFPKSKTCHFSCCLDLMRNLWGRTVVFGQQQEILNNSVMGKNGLLLTAVWCMAVYNRRSIGRYLLVETFLARLRKMREILKYLRSTETWRWSSVGFITFWYSTSKGNY